MGQSRSFWDIKNSQYLRLYSCLFQTTVQSSPLFSILRSNPIPNFNTEKILWLSEIEWRKKDCIGGTIWLVRVSDMTRWRIYLKNRFTVWSKKREKITWWFTFLSHSYRLRFAFLVFHKYLSPPSAMKLWITVKPCHSAPAFKGIPPGKHKILDLKMQFNDY